MILPDTNVISELLKPNCQPVVLHWWRTQLPETLFLAATVQAELLRGVALLPEGRRKASLSDRLGLLLDRYFAARYVPFDNRAAVAFAGLFADARRRGYTIGTMDGQVAAIASVNGFKVASRDEGPFKVAGIGLTNPWLTPT